jgi:hypothetical protein
MARLDRLEGDREVAPIAFSVRPASVQWWASNSGCVSTVCGNRASSTSPIRRHCSSCSPRLCHWSPSFPAVRFSELPAPEVPGTKSALGERFEKRSGVYEVRRREPFRVGAVDDRERGTGLIAAALPLPEPSETDRGPQLPRPALLVPRCLDCLAEAAFRCDGLGGRLGQQ